MNLPGAYALCLVSCASLACASTVARGARTPRATEPSVVDEPLPEAPVSAPPEPVAAAGAPASDEAAGAEDRAEVVEIPDLSPELIARIMKQQERVVSYAAKHGVDPELVNAVIWVESKFDPKAKGPAGAMGLMQLMPRTAGSLAKRLGRRSRPYDPDFALDAGCLYIYRIMKRFDGDLRLSLAAYNRGVGKVKSWVEAGEPLPERTAAYVDRVLAAKAWLPLLIARERVDAAPEPAPALSALERPATRVMLSP